MDKFVAFMEKHFIPVASKIGAQRHLVAIRDSFMVSMPLMILGALAVMINNLPIPGFQELMNSIFGGEAWKGFGTSAWNGTFAILSVLIAFLLAYHLANGYRKDGVSAGVIFRIILRSRRSFGHELKWFIYCYYCWDYFNRNLCSFKWK